jgi:hypothetical protein
LAVLTIDYYGKKMEGRIIDLFLPAIRSFSTDLIMVPLDREI